MGWREKLLPLILDTSLRTAYAPFLGWPTRWGRHASEMAYKVHLRTEGQDMPFKRGRVKPKFLGLVLVLSILVALASLAVTWFMRLFYSYNPQ